MRFVIPTLLAAVLATAVLAAPATAIAAPTEATLRYNIIVDSPVITLADVLHGAEAAGDVTLARAPQPGMRVALNPLAVARIAAERGILWRPPANLHRIMVERASQIVPADMVQSEIELALMAAAPERDLQIQLSGRRATLHVGTDDEPTVAVESMDYDPHTGRFTAIVAAPAGDPTAPREKLHGRAWTMVEVPVLARAVRPGEEITPADVAWLRVREDEVRPQSVRDAGELIGLSPKRYIAVSRMIRISDLQEPVMVAKGAIVSMIYRTGGLTLTASGRAMEDGGRDDVIRVMNDRSRVTVEATIVAPGQVVVSPTVPRISQLAD